MDKVFHPPKSLIVSRSTPSIARRDANVCLRSWKRKSWILAALTASGKAFSAQCVWGVPSLLGNTSNEGSIGQAIRPRVALTTEVIGTWRVSPFLERGIVITPALRSTSFHRRFAKYDL